jgi:ornithine carbamoyltransferase
MPALANTTIPKAAAPDLTRDLDLATPELYSLLDLAGDLKRSPHDYLDAARGRSIALLFEKPSLRTRLTFELAIQQMGGSSATSEGPIGVREPLKDVARNLDRWVDAIVARVFSQATIDGLARRSRVPVINALSDLYHPCQALADLHTISEHFGKLDGLKLAFIGDGNNVARSLAMACGRFAMKFILAAPTGYDLTQQEISQLRGNMPELDLQLTSDPREAVRNADAVVTDTWVSMGQESEKAKRVKDFAGFQVDDKLLADAPKHVVVLHCLPAYRGLEISEEVLEGPRSLVFQEAENRLHFQKGLLAVLLGGE